MKKFWPILLLVFVFAFYLRVMYLPQNVLTFGYDQARDALVTQQILAGDLKILGPPASTPGLYHGVFYYYFLAPAYALSKNPIVAAYWVAFWNALVVFLVFSITHLMTKKKLAAFLAAILYAISFEATQYATWLSNPTIAIWTVPLMYWGLWLWTKNGNKYGPILTAIGLGLSIQSEIFLLYHAVPLVIWLVLNKKKVKKKALIQFLGAFVLVISSMLLVELKFGFKGLGGVAQLISGETGNLAYAKSLGDYLILYLNQIGRIFAFNSYPGNIGYGGALVITLALWGVFKPKTGWAKFLALWLFSHLTVVTVGGTSTPFLMVGIGPAVSILLAVSLARWWDKQKAVAVLVLVLLLYSNLSMILKENPRGATLFAIQKDMLLNKQLQLIDYTYETSQGEPFSLNSLTSPLWINIVWTYLYEWYGQDNYGYLPTWHGRGQEGQLASLALDEGKIKEYYLILEPMGGIPTRYLEETIGFEDSISTLVEEKIWGELRVQKREKL